MNSNLILAICLAILMCSCGGGRTEAVPQFPALALQAGSEALLSVPFPEGSEAVERSISDDTVTLQGRDWFDRSETAEEVGSTLELNGPGNTWGMYVLGGFGQVQPGSVFASFFTEDGMPCRIYIGVADFASNRWVFADAGKDDFSFEFPQGGKYHSDAGNCYVVVLRNGEGTAKLYSLTFGRVGNTDLDAPAGLSGSAVPGLVSLDWQAVPNALGYNIYRDYDKKFENQLKLNEEPVTASEYADGFLVNGEMYFYRVSAVAAIESEYSDYISVYVPASELPAPTNLRLVESGDDYITFAWDWEGPSPQSWNVYLSHSADFNLEPPTEKKTIPQGGARQYKYTGLEIGRLYFIRMCARDSTGKQGQMTDALPCLTGDEWEWFEVEEVGDGKEPISCVIADNQICASYMLDNVVHVALNSGQGLPWTVESTDLDHTETFLDPLTGIEHPGNGFIGVLDIDYAGGTYLIASVTRSGNDFYAAFGAPGEGWTVERIDEGSAFGMFDVASAGLYGSVAISANGYVASGNDFELQQYCYYTRAFGPDKEWVKQEIRYQPESLPIEFDLEVLDGKLFASCFDFTDRQLYFWSEEEGFTQVTDNPEGTTFGIYTDLERMGSKWVTPGYHGAEQRLFLLTDNGGEFWDSELIYEQEGYRTGRNVRMEPFREGVVCVHMGDRTRDWYCSVLRSTGEWETQLMKIGEIDPYEKADLKVLNEQPVFVLADRITQKVYAIRGNIPFE